MFRSTVVTPPASTPITLAEAKEHLRVEHAAEDTLITSYLNAATEFVENFTRRKIVSQVMDIVFDEFPYGLDGGRMVLPFGNISAVESVTYADTDSSTVVLTGPTSGSPGTDYQESLYSDSTPFISPIYGVSWPSVVLTANPIVVRLTAGYGEPSDSPAPVMPESLLSAVRVMLADFYTRRATDDAKNYATIAAERLSQPWVLPVW